jgi:putative endonuclease
VARIHPPPGIVPTTGLASWFARLMDRLWIPSPERTGRWGERLAAKYLKKQGYLILARNYRIRGGEADLVATKDGWIVVVEVKARRSSRFGAPEEAINRRKTRRVLKAGRAFCRSRGFSLGRFRGDVISVERLPGQKETSINHWPGCLVDRTT